MPNIIEQQDLLKGLPDARLAMLLQNPVADIPPFLVAAEAQRRQALRQQFSGDANKESVVDSLTKQLAKVPQNIQAPAQMPPTAPPTPQMQGVAALQTQQAVQQAAQQAVQPQAMAGGGMVRRYQTGGPVQTFRGRQGAGGYMPGEEPAGFGILPDILGNIADVTSPFLESMRRFGATPTEEQKAIMEAEQKARDFEAAPFVAPLPDGAVDQGIAGVPGGVGRTGKPLAKRSTEAGKEGTSPQNRAEPQPLAGETEDEFRARLEALYAAQEPSDWEKAQRWFAMAEQFLDPSKTTMQSIAGAGQAFASAAGEQARAQREADLAREKGMLEYDMARAEERRAAAAAAAKDAREFQQRMQERGTPSADATISAIDRGIREIDSQIAELRKTDLPGVPIPPETQLEIDKLIERRRGLNKMMIDIMDRGGFVNRRTVTPEELASLGPL